MRRRHPEPRTTPSSPRLLLRAVGVVRLLTGAWFVVRARRSAELWTGDDRATTRALVRSIGARDLVIGTGLAASPGGGWLLASVASDISDGVFARELVPDRRTFARTLAFGFAILSTGVGAVTWRTRTTEGTSTIP